MFEPNNFQKMRVKNSSYIMSEEVASALKLVALKNTKKSTYLTTSWFIDQIAKWHKIMTSRSPKLSLSYHNIDKYKQTVLFLYEMIKLFEEMRYVEKINIIK